MHLNKDEILNNLDVENFYRQHIPSFKKAGKEWVAVRCPFHDDRNPSLSINLNHGGFICHGGSCGNRGDIFRFYMELRGVDFKTALEEIAKM